MTPDEPERRLAAALRAQASQVGTGVPTGPARPRPGLPTWAVLALAALLGAMAGVLTGVISAIPG